MTIGDRIIKLRESLLYKSQAEFAKACGMNQPALCQYENNVRKPSIEALKKLSKTCNVSIDYIVGNENNKSNDFISPVVMMFDKLNDKDKIFVIDIIKRFNESGG